MGLYELFNPVQTRESEADRLDFLVFRALFNDRIPRKGEAVVVLDRGEALVRQLDQAVREGEDAIDFEESVEVEGLFIEGCALDQCAFTVDKVEVNELTAASVVLPRPYGLLFDDTRFDCPVVRELVQSLDGHVGAGRFGLLHAGPRIHDSVGHVFGLLFEVSAASALGGRACSVCALVHFNLPWLAVRAHSW